VNSTNSPIKFVLDFLAELYGIGLEYRTIKCVQVSNLSLPCSNWNTPISQIKDVCNLLSGIDNLRHSYIGGGISSRIS